VVAHDEAEAARLAGTAELRQDPDVLDTWFSSALWPFSTLGWPEDTVDRRTFYPTDVLVTGFDILFFWVARMVMFGLHFTGAEPFRVVHLTGLVRDAEGQKMSKTKGNILDPEELVKEHGADALRFTLAALDSPGRDIPVDRQRMAGYQAFGNKIWNATRFSLARLGEAQVQEEIDPAGLGAPERWILSRLSATAADVDRHLSTFRFDEACNRLYHFFWGELCDWYIELAKPALGGAAGGDGAGEGGHGEPRPRVAEVLVTVLERSLRLLHPVMPHLTEELWQRLPGRERVHPVSIAVAPYPTRVAAWEDPALEERMSGLMAAVTRARALRAELALPPKAPVTLYLEPAQAADGDFLRRQEPLLRALVRPQELVWGAPPEGVLGDVAGGIRVGLAPAATTVELSGAERQRLEGELARLDGAIAGARGRLGDEAFLGKAPPQVVEQQRVRLAEMQQRREQIRQGLES
jgi:valyl-tRNA synthetase